MGLKKFFILALAFFAILFCFYAEAKETDSVKARIEQIDQKIQELEDMKRGFEARALRHENQAERLQFENQAYLETRRHNQLADENRAKAASAQKEIDRLQAEKKKLLENG